MSYGLCRKDKTHMVVSLVQLYRKRQIFSSTDLHWPLGESSGETYHRWVINPGISVHSPNAEQ